MEPERQIEKLLRASARKRREEAGTPKELHPAARRMLQAEVARLARKPNKGSLLLDLYNLLRPRLVFVLCALAVCFVSVSLLLPALSKVKSKAMVASNPAREARLARTDEQPPTATAPSGSVERLVSRQPGESSNADAVTAAGAVQPVETVTGANPRGTIDVALAGEEKKAENQPASPPATSLGRFGRGGGGGSGRGGFGGGRSGGGGVASLGQNTSPNKSAAESVSKDAARLERDTSNVALSFTNSGDFGIANGVASNSSVDKEAADRRNMGLNDSQGAKPTATAAPGAQFEQGYTSGYYRSAAQANAADDESVTRQQFVNAGNQQRTRAQASNSLTNALPLLNNFNVVQRGNELQVVDEDGSVYNGFVESTNMIQMSAAIGRAQPAARPETVLNTAGQATPTEQNYFFLVSGTNRSLKQNIRFSGNFVASENEAQFNLQTNAQIQNQFQKAIQNAATNLMKVPLANYRIDGTAELGNNQKLQINAVPSPPPAP